MFTTTRRALTLATIAVAVLIPATAGGDPAPPSAPTMAVQTADTKCPRGLHSIADYRWYGGRAYKRERVSRRAHLRLAYMLKCQHSAPALRLVARYHKRFKAARVQRQREAACTPYGEWAIPGYIVMRESGGRNVPNRQGSDASGFYQILRSTWLGAGGPNIPGVRFLAMAFAKGVQDCIANRLYRQSPNHWALTR